MNSQFNYQPHLEIIVPKNLKLSIISIGSLLITIGRMGVVFFLKSTTISLVLAAFSNKLLFAHHDVSSPIWALYADSSASLMSPDTVVSSANFVMWTDGWSERQSLVKIEYRSGDRTQPCGAPVLRVMVLDELLLNLTIWGRRSRKSSSQ